jgi:hypothetical protein
VIVALIFALTCALNLRPGLCPDPDGWIARDADGAITRVDGDGQKNADLKTHSNGIFEINI